MARVQIVILRSMADESALAKEPLQAKAVSFGIVTDKLQLMSGEATERHEHRDTDDARDNLHRRIDELSERRRARSDPPGVQTG